MINKVWWGLLNIQGVQKIEVTDLKVNNTSQNNKKVHICPKMPSFRPIANLIFYFCHSTTHTFNIKIKS